MIYYDEAFIRNYTDGFYVTLTRIGTRVFFYGSLIAKPSHTYKSIIPEKFRPKQNVQVIWNLIDTTLYPIVLNIDSNGVIKSINNPNNLVASGITIWETN